MLTERSDHLLIIITIVARIISPQFSSAYSNPVPQIIGRFTLSQRLSTTRNGLKRWLTV